MSVIATVILDEDVINAAVDAPDADLDPDSGLLDVDEAEEQVRALVDHYGEGLLNIWENDTITAATLPALVESALAFAAANPAATAADG